MTKSRLFALLLIATWAGFTWAAGPIVYKCGSSYSQIPCDGAVPLKIDDSRSKTQKSQSDAEVAQQRHKADAMEKSRLQDEALSLSNNQPSSKLRPKTKGEDTKTTPSKAPKATDSSKNSKKKTPEPEFFTAKESTDLKKKTNASGK
jgi:hypothetical protein